MNTNAFEYQIVRSFIDGFPILSDDEKAMIASKLHVKSQPKGTVLLKEGQVCKDCYFVLKGCIREYYIVEGIEKTTEFYTEYQTAISGSISKPAVSRNYLVCEEDTVYLIGNLEKEQSMFAEFPKLEEITRVMMEEDLVKTQQKLADFIISTPEERYKNLLEERSDILQRVPQHQIASYIGISPESLSRMRKRMAENRKKELYAKGQ